MVMLWLFIVLVVIAAAAIIVARSTRLVHMFASNSRGYVMPSYAGRRVLAAGTPPDASSA